MTPPARWKVVSIEMNQPLPTLSCDETYAVVRVVFCMGGIPLGHCRLTIAQLPLTPVQLAGVASIATAQAAGDYLVDEGFRSALPGLAEPRVEKPAQALSRLAELESPLARLAPRGNNQSAQPAVSIAICTRERPDDLVRCLTSMVGLVERPLEILVIDNAPESDATRLAVSRFAGVQYHREPQRGLSAARNTALALASGDVVAFADDDVVVHPDWVARIRACFSDPKVMVATGLVLPAELETQAQLLFEHGHEFFHQGYRRRYFDSAYFSALRNRCVPVWTMGAGANMAIRKRAWELGYRFDTRLGPGVFGGCGEDSEFWYRILAGGWSCVYEPAAYVFHYHRREKAALQELVHQYMKGHVAALILQFLGTGDLGNLRRLLFRLPAEYAILFLRLVATGFQLEYRIRMRGIFGCLAGLGFVFSRRRNVPRDGSTYAPSHCRTEVIERST